MTIIQTTIADIIVIEPTVFTDERGYFFESYRENEFLEKIGSVRFVQDNVTKSIRNTIRGLHFQIGEYAQGKLCQVVFGKVLDITVDLRKHSPTFGKHMAIELSDENKRQIWIPPGFAHGFSVLSDSAIFVYKCTNYYHKESERTLLYNDPDLHIDWKVTNPIISMKDQQGLRLKDLPL